jgi:O-antigen ligase
MTADAGATRLQRRRARSDEVVRRYLLIAVPAHVVLGVVLRWSSIASTVYVGATLLVALFVVLTARDIDGVTIAVAYIVATEVLWRMTRAHFFFEGGKYAMVALLVIASFRFFPGWRAAIVPAVYLASFAVSAVLSLRYFGGIVAARQPISFSLAGPIGLAVAVWFFSQARPTIGRFRMAMWAMVLPMVSIATITLMNTISAGSITFETQSNLTTSGGYSPNEVSSALGFGVLACVVLTATERDFWLRLLEIGLACWLFAEAVLTLSRGGIANVVVALLLAFVMLASRARNLTRIALLVAVVLIACGALLLPSLNDFTGGHLLARYQSSSTSRRDLIVRNDLDLFQSHPLLGVGIGVSQEMRPPRVEHQEAHTEYTRLLAEQGLFGVVALVAMLVLVITPFRRAPRGLPRALVAAFVGWSLVEMTHSATRLALTSFSIGLAVLVAGIVTEHQPRAPETETNR